MSAQLTIFDQAEPARRRDAGILKAVTHANDVHESWSEKTFKLFKEFLNQTHSDFMAEDFRSFCAMKDDYPLPPSARAFGGIIVRARKEGLIRSVGIRQVTNAKAHMANAAVWIKNKS